MKIAFAIPTYNRLEKLRKCVDSILGQHYNRERIQIILTIANSCSTDGTGEYIDEIQMNYPEFVAKNYLEMDGDKPKYVSKENWVRCFNSVPKDVDWVWILGDDDHLIESSAVQKLIDFIENNNSQKLSLIHCCQARRSLATGKVIQGNLFDICNSMGYHEMLGWMSSIVIKRAKLQDAMDTNIYQISQSAYAHSAAILAVCSEDDALFLDTKWVDPQDEQQTDESIARWQRDNMAEKYFYVIDDLLDLYEKKILKKLCTSIFFRYLTYSLWDRYAINIISAIFKSGDISQNSKSHLERMQKISLMLASQADKKSYSLWYLGFLTTLQNYVGSVKQYRINESALKNFAANLSGQNYPFTNLKK